MDKVQNKPNSSVQHTPSSESFQVYDLGGSRISSWGARHDKSHRHIFVTFMYEGARTLVMKKFVELAVKKSDTRLEAWLVINIAQNQQSGRGVDGQMA
jgi:hypothetical protein